MCDLAGSKEEYMRDLADLAQEYMYDLAGSKEEYMRDLADLAQEYMYDLANSILKIYWNHELPVNPIHFANRMRLRVYFREDITEGEYNESDNAIYINRQLSDQKKRFVIARELGHYLIQKKCGKHLLDKASLEAACIVFALTLLIPEPALSVLVNRGLLLNDLCKAFDVSEWSMQIRLYDRGYI